MNNECEIVRDLLPLYLDNLCSEPSKEYIEEHIEKCEECKMIFDEAIHVQDVQTQTIKLPDEEDIIRQTSWKLRKRAITCAVGITSIIVYWIIYLWQIDLANQGIYRYFSYSFHEMYSVGYVLVPLLTAVWLVMVIVGTIRKKCWRKNAVIAIVLAVLLFLQCGYLYDRSNVIYCDTWTEVVSIPDEYHIVIDNGESQITLETTPNITRLLNTDGTVYGFSYEIKEGEDKKGILYGVWNTND